MTKIYDAINMQSEVFTTGFFRTRFWGFRIVRPHLVGLVEFDVICGLLTFEVARTRIVLPCYRPHAGEGANSNAMTQQK